MKIQITTLLIFLLFYLEAFSQDQTKPLPNIIAPKELAEANSEFVEGTITRLTKDEIELFLPFAQNAQSILSKSLKEIESMKIGDQTNYLTAIMRSVVRNSGTKNYQMFMRFALNRTLLLAQELLKESDLKTPGTIENVLDLQIKGIQVALDFYESDLSFQKRLNSGDSSIRLDYAKFGVQFGLKMISSVNNVLDASAQYRLLYKIYEMINWDLSRDQYAQDVADTIVQIYNTLGALDEFPAGDDTSLVSNVRTLNLLLNITSSTLERLERAAGQRRRDEQARLEQQREEQARIAKEKREREFISKLSVGDKVIATRTLKSGVIHEIRNNLIIIRYPEGSFTQEKFDKIAVMKGCISSMCYNEVFFIVGSVFHHNGLFDQATLKGIDHNGDVVIRWSTGPNRDQLSHVNTKFFARTQGCLEGICVGDKMYNIDIGATVEITGIFRNRFVILFQRGPHNSWIEHYGEDGWGPESLTKI